MPTAHPLQLGAGRRRFHLLQTTPGPSRPRGAAAGADEALIIHLLVTNRSSGATAPAKQRQHPEEVGRPASFLLCGAAASGPLSRRTHPLLRNASRRTPHRSRPDSWDPAPPPHRKLCFPPPHTHTPQALYLLVGCGELLPDHGTVGS